MALWTAAERVSLMTDAQGKVISTALLRMELQVPEEGR